jgi:RNA polymerase sigma-70 factor (ECF subfamily)
MDGVAQRLDGFDTRARDDAGARKAAFAAIVDRHAALMYRVAFSLLKNPQDAEDAVQETLLKLYRGEAWRAMEDEKSFLARSVWRVGLNRLSTQGAKAMRNAADVAEMELASGELTPEQNALGSAERQLMRELIEELPEGFRQALVLSAIEGMRSQEVAEVLGINEGTVRTRVLRAKAELRRIFLERTAKTRGGRR